MISSYGLWWRLLCVHQNLFSLLPGHIDKLYLPISRAFRYSHVSGSWPLECGWKWCVSFPHLAHESVLCMTSVFTLSAGWMLLPRVALHQWSAWLPGAEPLPQPCLYPEHPGWAIAWFRNKLKKKTTCVKRPRFWGLWQELTLLSQIEAGNVLRGRAGKPSLQSADSKAFCLCGLGGHYHNCSTVAAAVGKQRKYVSKWVWLCFNQNCPQTGSWTT